MTTWATADPHFGHKNILNYCNRPWAEDPRNPTKAEAYAMDSALVRNWNAVVEKGDDVYIVGDLAYCTEPEYVADRVYQLRGRKHLIRGNHDQIADTIHAEYPGLFASYTPGYLETEVEGQTIIMCHYAMREWHHALRGTWHIFGHTHGTLPPFGKSVDVGVDNVHAIVPGASYRPISFAELKVFMDKQPIGSHPAFEHFRAPEK
jgi:calcineurin-like phosphoesterase family protein